jgi:hypothetical protein
MKRFLSLALFCAFLLFSLYTSSQSKQGMEGAYALINQTMNINGKDSGVSIEQIKLYTNRYMIYAHKSAADSLADYGIGTYKAKNGGVTEFVFYTSGSGAHNDTFEVNIKKTTEGYIQTIDFPSNDGNKYVLTESYKNVGKNVSSPLDGAWKQTKLVYTAKDGKSSTYNDVTQFKVYQSGNFVWVTSYKDSATNKLVSAFGYGSFEMKGARAAIETNTHSTYMSQLFGKPVTIQLEFTGKDSYQQTIVSPDGGKTVEYYERLK